MQPSAMSALTSLDLVLGLCACFAAILMGIVLAKRQARAFKADPNQDAATSNNGDLPEVTFADYGGMRFLHLGTPAVQGSMKVNKPFDIHLDYVQRMMAWLLFTNIDQLHTLHAMQLGLGAASLTKFTHHYLGMQTTAVELNPQVISTCKRWFNLPENNATLQVVLLDAFNASQEPQWQGKIDALQVDLYDQDASHPTIDSEVFYQNCRNMLTPQGCMTVNLFGKSMNYAKSLEKICAVFGANAVWAFKPTTAGNTIVLAFRTPCTTNIEALQAQAQAIEARWPLPATKWLKLLSPVKVDMPSAIER